MNEEQRRALLSWGYKVELGVILDGSGNYVPSVTKNGMTINSTVDKDLWESANSSVKKAQAEETPNPIKALEKFEKDPLKTPMTKDMKESYPYYKQMQEKVDKAGYFTPEDFEKYEEERAIKEAEENGSANHIGILRSLQQKGHNNITEDLINSVKKNAEELHKIESENKVVKKEIDKKNDTQEQLDKNSWYNPQNISLKLEQAVVGLAKMFISDDAGVEDKSKEKYNKLLAEQKELKAPAAAIIREDLKLKKEKLEDLYSRKSMGQKWGREADMLRYAINEIEAKETGVDDFINGANVYNPANAKFLFDVGTAGIQGLVDGYLHYQPLMKKINAGEKLTEAEQAVAESFASSYEADGLGLEQSDWYNLTEGTAYSAAFMASMVGPGAIMKGVSKAISTKVAKEFMEMGFSRTVSKVGGKVYGETASTFGKVALNPTTHTNALEHYYGPIRYEDNEDGELRVVTTDRRDHRVLMEKADLEIESLKDKISKEQDPEKVKELNYQISKIEDGKRRIAPLPTVLDAIGYGFTEVLKEVAVEQYGGALANKLVNNRLTRGATASPWAQNIKNSAVGKAFSKANNMFGDAKTAFNGLVGETGEKLIGNNLEEMAEEIVVQILPVWGETEEEAIQRKGELLSASFYGQVAGQTLLMGGAMKAIYSPMKAYNNYITRQGQKEERDAFKNMMNSFKEGNLSEDKVTELLMGAGHSGFSIQEYNNKIAKARQEGRHDVANDLERNRTYNSGKALVKIGKGKEFVRTMEGLIATGNIPAESIANVQEAVNEVKTLERETKEYERLRNKDYILELKSKERYTNNQKSKLEKRQSELLAQKESPERDGELEGIKDALKENETLSKRLSKAIKHETSPKMVKKLQLEADMTRDLVTSYRKSQSDTSAQDAIDSQAKRLAELEQTKSDILQEEDSPSKTQRLSNINEVIEKFTTFSKESQDKNKTKTRKESREEAIKKLKNKYGWAVTPADYKRAQKQLDRAILTEITDELLEKTMNQTEEEFNKEQETPVEVSKSKQHVVDLASSIDEVTAMINNTPGKQKPGVTPIPDVVSEPIDLEVGDTATKVNTSQDSEMTDPEMEDDGYSKLADPEITPIDDSLPPEITEENLFDDMPDLSPLLSKDDKGAYENEAVEKLVRDVEKRVAEMKEEAGVEITFQDYIDDLLDKGEVPRENIEAHFRALALGWSGANLGPSNWTSVYKNLFKGVQAAVNHIENKNNTPSQAIEEATKVLETEEQEILNKNSTSKPLSFAPKTEGPVHITPNTSKTYGTELTLHYSAVEFEHEVQEIDGKKVYVKVQQAVPKLRETNKDYSFKDLVNPNKNNIGSTLKPVLLQGDQLADYRIAVRDEYGRQTSTISFEEWVDKNKPAGMKLEDFQETDLYIGQVPIVYHDSQGKPVAPVTEVDWYTPTSVGDRSKTVDEIDLDNLTESHKQDIEENRKQALEIRKAILDGTLIEMEIADNLGHFPLQIIGKTDSNGDPVPTKSLNEVSPDSQIVWMSSTGALYDLDKKVINTADILNMGDDTEGFLKTETITEYDNDGNVKSKQKLPIFRNRTHYLSHVATVDGVKKYMILNTQRKNEDQGNSANREDVETARWIAAVNNITMFANTPSGSEIAKDLGHPLNMFPEQAEDIRRQVKEITGIDIKHEYSTLIEGLVAYQTPSKPGEKMGEKVTFASKMVGKLKAYNKSTGEFTNPAEDYVQNTYMSKGGFSLKDKPMITIKKVDGKFVVEKVKTAPKMVNGQESTTADTYDQFLKERLSTNVMGYNVGTEKEPVYTIAVQQKIKLKPVYKTESTEETLDKNIEAKKKDPEVKAKVEEVEDKSSVLSQSELEDAKAEIEDRYNKVIEEEGLNILTPITLDERGLSTQEIQEGRKKQAEQVQRDRRLAELMQQKQKEISDLESKTTTSSDSEQKTKIDKEARKIAVENATALAAELNLDIRDIDLSDDMVVAEMTSTENVDKSIASIEKVSVKQEEEVISWLFSKLAAKDADIKEVKQSLETELKTRIDKIDKAIADLKEFDDNAVVQNLMGTLLAAKEQAESTLNATDKLLAEASLRAVNTAFITDEYVEDETVENVKDFSKSDSQTKPIDKVGTALKRVFAQIPNGKTGFLGLTSFASFKQMYDTVSLALSNDINLTPNFKEMMDLLSKREESAPWMKPLIDTLMESDEQVKNQFVYNAYKQKVNAKFATLSFDRDKNVISNIYDSNSNEAKRAVVESWKENFKRSPLNDEGKISKDGLKAAINQWNSWFDSGTDKQTDAEYQNWLDKFGIKLSPKTWAALRRGELNTSQDGGRLQPATFQELFKDLTVGANKKRSGNLFSNLMRFATLNIDKEGSDLEFYNNTKNHPFDDMGTILNQLSELESRYNPVYSSTSRYVNGKSVSEIESMSYFYEQLNKLKKSAFSEDKTYLNDLQGLSFSKDSFILQLLREDPVFADQFNHGLVDLMSLKELYKKSPMFAGIDELSELDYMFTQRAMFQNRNQGKERFVGSSPFKIRMASMSTLTNSDKGRMMLLKTAVFDFYKQSEQAFEITDQGEVKFTEDLNNLLYDSLIMPELRRMVNFSIRHKDVDTKDNKTNIKAYDKGAVRFNLIPGLNVLKGTDGKNIIEFIEEITSKEKSEEAVLNAIKLNFGEVFSNSIQDNVIKEAEGNVKSLSQFEVSKDVDSFNNVDYLKQRSGEVSENMKIAELDYILNSMMTNMNYMQLMAGDPALYYKSKLDEKSNDVVDQNKISQELAINLGKRMAAMIAPGSVLADSNNNTYVQVFLDDINGTADNILDIVEWHYGDKVLNEKNASGTTYKELLENLKNGDRKNLKELQNKFKNVAEFLDIESTDAQEYTTLKEHLYVMEKQGRLSEKEMKAIQSNLAKGKDLTKKQLKLVLQPIKPVYTGTILDTEQDVNRMMYIKSSSFPLIPQLTRGRKLDDLRKNMEQLEKDLETTVRASYQTANKVGALTNVVKDFSAPIKLEQTLKMNREHFKIQQDVPNKSDKVQDDTVSMGTQIFKLLMGDGIMEMDGFKFDGKEFTGKELQAEFHNIFSQMVGLKKDKFLKSLGLDKDMKAVDSEATLYKFEKLLIKEAKSRGFSKQDLNSLKLIRDPKTNELTFKMPLWMSGNSDKYESMMNALINNKIFAQKIPGNKFVTGSEAGFEIKDTMKGVDKSRIVHLGNFKGDVLQSTRTKEGGLTKAQVLAPSKFKINGTLIDLFEDFNGTDGTYLELFEGNIRIKPGMIDPKLLEQFVFRIPTSSHGLGTSVEIVGFLPPESGDLIITPKGFVAQMGQDFDIDSLTAYQYNHIVMEDGSIKELTEENKEAYLKETAAKIDYLSTLIKDNKHETYNKLLESVPGVDLSQLSQKEMLEELATAKENLNKDYDLKLLENKFIGVHNAVYSNPQAQKNINKVLSMSFAEQQADDIESLTLTSDNSFNILSPKYQMQKMNAGSTGQDAIGVYAKGVTLHSLAQQAQASGKDIRLGSQIANERKLKKIQIGNLQSDGRLGMTETIKSKDTSFKSLNRRISTVLDERTNTGTDNEKAQILGRTGLNHMDAISVDNLLSLLGFDAEYTRIYSQEEFDNLSYEKKQDAIVYEEGKPFHRKQEIDGKTVYFLEHSIPYLLHSQPIIREYFASINEKKSITTSFSGKAEEVVLQELIAKYADKSEVGEPAIIDGEFVRLVTIGRETIPERSQDNGVFTGQLLQNQITLGEKSDNKIQLQILATYVDLISQAKNVKKMMQHVDLNNLGKSMWESTTKAQNFRDFFKEEGQNGILGSESLLGDFYSASDIDNINESRKAKTTTVTTTKKVKKLVKKKSPLNKYELFPGVFANKEQSEAIDAMTEFLKSDEKTFVLSGRGGTGKTTIVKKIAEANRGKSIMYVAPTHKAKAVLSASVGVDASTLASALGIKLNETTGKFEIDAYSRKVRGVAVAKKDIIIIDESSMISDELLDQLMEDIGPKAKIIFMGDNAQLPPVGQEKDSKVFDFKGKGLTERMRQGEESPIVPLSDIIAENVETENPERVVVKDRKSDFDKENNEGVLFIENETEALESFVEDYKNNPESTKIITFNNQVHNSPQSVKNLNAKVRKMLFGERSSKEYIIEGEQLMAYDTLIDTNDNPVIENAVDYTVTRVIKKETISKKIAKSTKAGSFSTELEISGYWVELTNNITGIPVENPETGTAHFIPDEEGKEVIQKEISRLFKDKKTMPLGFAVTGSFINVNHGYAITSHKAQGSTYRNAYVMEDNMLGSTNGGGNKAKNQALYVGVSRASHKLVMVSSLNKDSENVFEEGSRLSRDARMAEKVQDQTKEGELEEFEEIEVDETTTEEVVKEEEAPLRKEDLIYLGEDMYLDPKTNQGSMVGTALSLSESLFTDFFPAKSVYLNKIIEDILQSTEVNVNNSFAYIKAKEQIFQEVKKYLTSNDKLGIFNKPSSEVRKTLFIDDKVNGNVSLSSYVNNLMSNSSSEFAPGIDKVQNNLFLNLLKTPMGENGKPSLITFNNQESFEANQEAIYSSFKELISEDLSLPRIQRNGESEAYSTRQLAQDLIAYSYASGGIVQGALQFHKFLPMEYLDDMTQVTSSGNTMSITDRIRRFNILNNDSVNHSILSNFEKQYFQNNPEAAVQSEMKATTMANGSEIFFPEEIEARRSKFISKKLKTDSKLKQDKWALYEKVEGEDYYRQVSVLGENGMSEYEFGTKNLNSNLGTDKFKESTQIRNASFIEHKDLGKIPENNSSMVSFLEGIVSGEYDMPADKKAIAEYLIKFVDPKATFKYEEGDFKGRSTPGEVMRLNLNKMKSRQDLATTFMHEAIHEITSGFINTYIDGDNKLIEGAPSELQSLNILFENYKSELYKKDPAKYVAFQEKWKQRQIARAAGNADVITYTKQEVEDFGAYYPIVNLKEFVAVALSNNEKFISTAGKMKYLETGGSVAKKFGELMTRILKRIGMANNIEENTVALQAIGRSLSLIDKIGTIKNEAKTVENNPSVTPDDMVSIKAKILELNAQNNKREILPIKTTKNTCK